MQRLVLQIQQGSTPDTGSFSAQSRFVTDLGMKSLELIGLVFICEQTFGVSLISQPGLLAKLETIGQAVDAIRKLQLGYLPEGCASSDEARAS